MKHKAPYPMLLLALVLALLAQPVWAQQPEPAPATPVRVQPNARRPNLRQQLTQQQNNGHPLQRWLRNQMTLLKFPAMELTPEQDQQLREIPARHEAEWKELTRQVNRARRAFDMLLLQNEAATPEMITQRSRALGVAEARFAQLVAEVWNEVKQVLTPEQLQRLNELRIEQLQLIRQRQLLRQQGNGLPSGEAQPLLDQRPLPKRQNKLQPNRPMTQPASPRKG